MDARSKLVDMVEEGLLDPVQFAIMVANWMTNDDIKEMLWANEIEI
jgi:cytochrome c551/c552